MNVVVRQKADLVLPPACNRHRAQMAGAWDRPETWECQLCTKEREVLTATVEDLCDFLAHYDGIGDDLWQWRQARELVARVKAV